jgi:peptide/nickel transport system substrate-binding protein
VPTTTAGAVSKAAFLHKHGKRVGQPGVGIVGTGPYKFVSWTKGQEVVLERFDGYWNKRRALKVKRLVFKVIQDEATIVAALGTGAVDGTFGNSISARSTVNLVKRFPDVKLYQSPSYLIHYLIINVQRKPFNDPRVCEALSYAIDKAGLLKSVWAGLGQVVKSPVMPALWTYEQGIFKSAYRKLPAFAPDIKKAKGLIEAAGAKGATASMLVSTSFEQELGLAIQAAGKQIGLNLTLTKVPATQKLSREFSGKPRDYDMSVSEWGSDIPDPSGNLVLPFMSQNLFTNDSQFRNPTVDRIFDEARATLDPARRARLLAQGQSIVVGKQPWIVLYSPTSSMVLNKRVTGYKMRPLWYWDPWAADLYGV